MFWQEESIPTTTDEILAIYPCLGNYKDTETIQQANNFSNLDSITKIFFLLLGYCVGNCWEQRRICNDELVEFIKCRIEFQDEDINACQKQLDSITEPFTWQYFVLKLTLARIMRYSSGYTLTTTQELLQTRNAKKILKQLLNQNWTSISLPSSFQIPIFLSICCYNLGIIYADHLEKEEKCIYFFKKSIEWDDQFAYAYTNLGSVYHSKQGKSELALEYYNIALTICPNDCDTLFDRALLYESIKNCDAAIQDYTSAIHLNPTDGDMYINRGSVYYRLHNFSAALSDYTNAIECNPYDSHAWCNRASVYFFEIGNLAKALADWKNAIEICKYDDSNILDKLKARLKVSFTYFVVGDVVNGLSNLYKLKNECKELEKTHALAPLFLRTAQGSIAQVFLNELEEFYIGAQNDTRYYNHLLHCGSSSFSSISKEEALFDFLSYSQEHG